MKLHEIDKYILSAINSLGRTTPGELMGVVERAGRKWSKPYMKRRLIILSAGNLISNNNGIYELTDEGIKNMKNMEITVDNPSNGHSITSMLTDLDTKILGVLAISSEEPVTRVHIAKVLNMENQVSNISKRLRVLQAFGLADNKKRGQHTITDKGRLVLEEVHHE